MMDFFFSNETRRNPFPWYDQVRAVAPVFHEPTSDRWLLFDYESVKRALTDHEAFSSAVTAPTSPPGRWLLFSDPPRHDTLRALIMRAFTPRAVTRLEPRIAELAHTLLDACVERDEVELLSEFSVPLPLMVIAEMLGAPVADWPRFRKWSDVIMTLIFTLSGGEASERAILGFRAVHAEMQAYLEALADERRAAPRDDLLSGLVHAEVEGDRLSNDDLLGIFQLLLLAGHETSTNLINNAVLSLLEHPDELHRLQSHPELVPSAVEEVLRFRSPVQAMFRVTTREVQMRTAVIPSGRLVIAMIGSANRDPLQFANANRFDVTRQPNPHIAFGHGIHFCLGAPLARLEARIALGALLSHVGTIELAGSEPWEPRAAFHVHGPARLPVRLSAGSARRGRG
jgi:Cytochrome P450